MSQLIFMIIGFCAGWAMAMIFNEMADTDKDWWE